MRLKDKIALLRKAFGETKEILMLEAQLSTNHRNKRKELLLKKVYN